MNEVKNTDLQLKKDLTDLHSSLVCEILKTPVVTPLSFFMNGFASVVEAPKKKDRSPDVDEPTVQLYWENADGSCSGQILYPCDYFCPNCGQKNCYEETGYEGETTNYYCFDCRFTWAIAYTRENDDFVLRTKLANEPEQAESHSNFVGGSYDDILYTLNDNTPRKHANSYVGKKWR